MRTIRTRLALPAGLAAVALAALLAGGAAAAPANPWSPAERYADATQASAYVHWVKTASGYDEVALNGWKWNSNGCVVRPGDVLNRLLAKGGTSFDVVTNSYVYDSSSPPGPRNDKCGITPLAPVAYTVQFVLDSSYGRMQLTTTAGRNFDVIWVDTHKPRVAFAGGTIANGQATLRYAVTDDGEWAAVRVVARQGAKVVVDTWLSLEDARGVAKTASVYVSDARKGRLAVCLTAQDKAKNTGAPACRTLVVT